MAAGPQDLWVFGYGSLMWQPGFAFAEASHARLAGYHRAFCIYSVHYRGTAERPGLVLGLDRGGVCEGIAYRVAAEGVSDVLDYLRRRELIYGVYREALLPARLLDGSGTEVRALAYVVERAHPSYAGRLSLGTQAGLIRSASGRAGANLDYLANTIAHMAELGIRERQLERLHTCVGALVGHHMQGAGNRTRARSINASWRCRPAPARAIRRDQRARFGHRMQIAAFRAKGEG